MKCPACGARNAEDATWCTQCFTAFPGASPAPPAAEPVVAEPAAPPPPVAPEAGPPVGGADPVEAPAAHRPVGKDGRFRRSGEGIDWSCARCESWNPIEISTCAVCGASFSRSLQEDVEPEEPPRRLSESEAILSSIALPGLAHLMMRRTLTGLTRAGMYVMWLLGGLVLARGAAENQQSLLPSLPLLLGALVLLGATAVDALSLARGGDDVILTPRVFLWLIVAVIGLLIVAFMTSALALRA